MNYFLPKTSRKFLLTLFITTTLLLSFSHALAQSTPSLDGLSLRNPAKDGNINLIDSQTTSKKFLTKSTVTGVSDFTSRFGVGKSATAPACSSLTFDLKLVLINTSSFVARGAGTYWICERVVVTADSSEHFAGPIKVIVDLVNPTITRRTLTVSADGENLLDTFSIRDTDSGLKSYSTVSFDARKTSSVCNASTIFTSTESVSGTSSITTEPELVKNRFDAVCIKVEDAAGNITFFITGAIFSTTGWNPSPRISISLDGDATDGYINAAEKARTSDLLSFSLRNNTGTTVTTFEYKRSNSEITTCDASFGVYSADKPSASLFDSEGYWYMCAKAVAGDATSYSNVIRVLRDVRAPLVEFSPIGSVIAPFIKGSSQSTDFGSGILLVSARYGSSDLECTLDGDEDALRVKGATGAVRKFSPTDARQTNYFINSPRFTGTDGETTRFCFYAEDVAGNQAIGLSDESTIGTLPAVITPPVYTVYLNEDGTLDESRYATNKSNQAVVVNYDILKDASTNPIGLFPRCEVSDDRYVTSAERTGNAGLVLIVEPKAATIREFNSNGRKKDFAGLAAADRSGSDLSDSSVRSGKYFYLNFSVVNVGKAKAFIKEIPAPGSNGKIELFLSSSELADVPNGATLSLKILDKDGTRIRTDRLRGLGLNNGKYTSLHYTSNGGFLSQSIITEITIPTTKGTAFDDGELGIEGQIAVLETGIHCSSGQSVGGDIFGGTGFVRGAIGETRPGPITPRGGSTSSKGGSKKSSGGGLRVIGLPTAAPSIGLLVAPSITSPLVSSVVKTPLNAQVYSFKDLPDVKVVNVSVSRKIVGEGRVGSYGDNIKSLQVFLNNNGFAVNSEGFGSAGQETNYFGPATKGALIKYQAANDIPSTGVLDADTLNKINKNVEEVVVESLDSLESQIGSLRSRLESLLRSRPNVVQSPVGGDFTSYFGNGLNNVRLTDFSSSQAPELDTNVVPSTKYVAPIQSPVEITPAVEVRVRSFVNQSSERKPTAELQGQFGSPTNLPFNSLTGPSL